MQEGNRIIKLNVGGKRFETLRSTLLSVEGTYFSGLLKDCENPNEEYFIDRDGEKFGQILRFLRGDRDVCIDPVEAMYYSLPLPSLSFHELVQKDILLVRDYFAKFQFVFIEEMKSCYLKINTNALFKHNSVGWTLNSPASSPGFFGARPKTPSPDYIMKFFTLIETVNHQVIVSEAKAFWACQGIGCRIIEKTARIAYEIYFSWDISWNTSFSTMAAVSNMSRILVDCSREKEGFTSPHFRVNT